MERDPPTFDPEVFLPFRLGLAADRLRRGLDQRYRGRYGLSMTEWRFLALIAREGAVSARDIERRTEEDKSRVSRNIARLVEKGYVARDVNPADRRSTDLSATEAGERLLAEFAPVAEAHQAEILARLGENGPGLMRALDLLLAE